MSLLSLLSSCSRSNIVEGGLYCEPNEKGGYSILKVLKIDDAAVHVRIYSNHYATPPKKIDESTLYLAGLNHKSGETLGIGHVPISKKGFLSARHIFIQQSTVTEEELEGYKIWLEAH